MQKKKIIIITSISILIVVSIVCASINKINNKINNGIPEEIQKAYKLQYSKAYSQYMSLSDEEKHKLGVVPRKYDVSLDTLETGEKVQLKTLVKATTTPTKFSLLDSINIKVEAQNNYGTCWAFASLNALETNLALKTGETYDFSESHIDHLMSPAFNNNDRYLHQGGMFYYFMEYVMSDYGPVLESEVPYENEADPYDATDYEQWKRLKPTIDLVEVVDMPTIDKKEETYTDAQLAEFREKVKTHIMQNGSLYASVLSTEIKTYNGRKVLNAGISAELPDHAITIIGWDDEFAITNFPSSCRPSAPGAYIALNSWGSDWGENGIFYISYEDIFVEMEMSGVVSTTKTFNYTDFSVQDEAFYTALKQEMNGKCIDAIDETKKIKIKEFTKNNMKYLELVNKQINSIEGVQALIGLYYMNLSQNNLISLTPIVELTNLAALKVSDNKIGDLEPILHSTVHAFVADMQNITENSPGKVIEYNIPKIFSQGYMLSGSQGTSISAKIYYNCNRNEVLDESTAVIYNNLTINASTAKIILDKEVNEQKPNGTRAIKVTINDTGFVNGTTYIFYYDVLRSDVNNDEIVDSMDAYIALKLVLSGTAVTSEQVKLFDMNSDGKVTLEDVNLILQKVVE